jgi:hypothetical protein
MTPKEALEEMSGAYLNYVSPSLEMSFISIRNTPCYPILKNLVAKATPMKVDNLAGCGKCGRFVGIRGEEFAYCPHCGQALDWSDEK